MYYFDPTYILIIIGMILSLMAQAAVQSNFSKYSRVHAMSNMTGAEVADRILKSQGLYDVSIEHISGNLTDHYDPTSKILRLSDSTYNSSSVAAIGVAAHECGHAIQHSMEYAPLSFRSMFVPIANIGAKISWPLILVGFLISNGTPNILVTAGILAFSAAVVFHLITLPVEFDASNRALKILGNQGILGTNEVKGVKKVLNAAALTYLAAAAASILQLLRLIILFGGRRDD
ncbi:MAG: zinc metallopeptidase [Lachnospiraceae bacterium]|nr:zinc metallopeptidase [Lachnospiraceae bacterium]